jgi:iron complex outermembrane recepter protein
MRLARYWPGRNLGSIPMRFTLLVACALAACSALLAQSGQGTPADEPLVQSGPPEVVVVTASRLDIPLLESPGATTVVVKEDIEKTESKTIAADEALKFVPGVKVDNQADGERVHLSIRGEGILTERGIRRIMVLLDGLPLNDPTGLVPDLFDVDWDTVHRVEVLRGPASSLYGGGAAGGVINIETRNGGAAKAEGEAAVHVGSYGFEKYFAEADGTSGTMTYRVSASRMLDDGYRVHTASDATNLYAKMNWATGTSGHLTAIMSDTEYFNENAEGLNAQQVAQDPKQPNPDAVTKNEYQDTRRTTVGLTGDYSLTQHQDLSFAAYSRRTAWRESVPSSVIYRTYDNPGGLLQYTLRTGTGAIKNEFSAGTDLAWQSVGEEKMPNPLNLDPALVALLPTDVEYGQRGVGVYAMDRVELSDGWGLVGGIRRDSFRNEFDNRLDVNPVLELPDYDKTTGRLAVTWNPLEHHGFYANWGQGFTPPNTEELINNPAGFGGFNENLVAETTSGEELGARGAIGKHGTYDVAVFHMTTDNDFGRYRVPGRTLETFYYNAGNSTRYGLEASVAWNPLKNLATHFAYTYSHFKYDDVISPPIPLPQATYHDTWLPNIPQHQGYVDVEYTPGTHFMLGASFEGLSRAYVDPTNKGLSLPYLDPRNTGWSWGYGLIHFRAAYRWQAASCNGDVSFVVRNLGDRDYIAYTEPDPDGNSYHPAPGREIFLSARIRLGGERRGA